MKQRLAIIVRPVAGNEVGAMKMQTIIHPHPAAKLLAAALLLRTSVASFADDPQLPHRLPLQHAATLAPARPIPLALPPGLRSPSRETHESPRAAARGLTLHLGRGAVTYIPAN